MLAQSLTERRQTFIEAYIESGDVSAAVNAAGFSHRNYGYALLKEQSVQALLRVAIERRRVEDVVFSRIGLRKLADNEAMPAGARVTAYRTLLELAGAMGKGGDDLGPGKDIGDMSTDELRAMVSRLDRELGDRAKIVDGTETQAIPTEVADMTA